MDKAWSETNKQIQKLLGKKDTFPAAIENIISFRAELFEQIRQIVDGYPEEAFYQMPFPNVDGYHSKTLTYSIWHIFRIEDIVAHEMIAGKQQILFQDDFLKRIQSPIITTGNELIGEGIVDFSRQLDVKELFLYANAVMESTNQILKELTFEDTKIKFDAAMRDHLATSGCVSEDPSAFWLIDYWCGKNIAGLIKMPFTRHWIMHIEAMRRIKNKL